MTKVWRGIALVVCLCALGVRPVWSLDPSSRLAQYAHTAWRSSEGHFGSEPAALTQTQDGYLWIASASGLSRFDGVRFLKWNGVNGIKLVSNNVYSLFVDHDGLRPLRSGGWSFGKNGE